jgi:hypothetical protein
MSSERIDPEFREAVVTYSWVPSRERGFTQDPVPAERREPTLDATEIHVLDGHDLDGRDLDGRDGGNLDFAVRSERRSDEGPAPAAPLDLERKRSPVARIVFATAALSIVAGVGVLAATVGIATITPSRTPAASSASAPPALAAVEPKEEATPASGIREIPLATGKDAASATPTDVEPPLPRARPDENDGGAVVTSSEPVPAKTEPAPAKAELRPSAEPVKPTVATLPPPAKSVPTLPPPTAPVTPASVEAGGTDALISDIEARLAERDAASPQTPTSDPHGMMIAPAGEGPVAVLPPPASMAPGYPSPSGTYPGPSSNGATYDLVPPEPVTGNGYGNSYPPAYPAQAYPPAPVPPADVPYGTPAQDAYGYPSRPMDYEMIPEKKPGFLKRTWMRTAEAVKDVFTKDEEELPLPPN